VTTLNQTIHVVFYVLLALSSTTLVFLIMFLVQRCVRKRDYTAPKIIATWAGVCTSVGSFALSIVNFNFPIGILPEQDRAAEAIKQYYEAVQDRRCDDAWNLIHSARKKILADDRNFARDQFCEAYETTQTYQNLELVREDKKNLMTSRLYRVAYDVEDVLVRNNLYDLQLKDFADVMGSGPWNEAYLTNAILDNLRLYYIVPDEIVPQVKGLIARVPFW
jgi:hypothetical protein